jgi:cell shape-determining protein MreC
MKSLRKVFLPLAFLALLILGLPEEVNRKIHTKASSIVASMLNGTSEPRDLSAQEALVSWNEEREEEYQSQCKDSGAALDNKCLFIVGRVIFQVNTPWSSTIWVDVGKQTKDIPFRIQKNCPVVVRDSLIGIVDFVGKQASRIRLLSDPSVRPAVRVVRENNRTRQLVRSIQEIQKAVSQTPSLLPKPELTSALTRLLDCLMQSLPAESQLRLAKGELQGAEYPSSPTLLRGVGFNYDFEDEEGQGRDLRTGQRNLYDQKILLIKPGDLLETSGLDGIFPRGLRVATVSTVFPLEEGAISYQILAKIDNLDFPHFDHVTIIPAQPKDPLSPPSDTEIIKSVIEEASR